MTRGDRAQAWARIAHAAVEAERRREHRPGVAAALEREVRAAVTAAATDARLEWREMVDAYLAGAPWLYAGDAEERIGEQLAEAARHDQLDLEDVERYAQREPPDWPRRLQQLVDEHDHALAERGRDGAQDARRAVVRFIDEASAAGVNDAVIDVCLRSQRRCQCDLLSVLHAARAIVAERERLAARRGQTLPDVAWATDAEIARDRGVDVDVARELVDHAVSRGLLQRVPDRGVRTTAAGRAYTECSAIARA